MKFSGSNLEQAFYPVEEKVQVKRTSKKKRSKASDISIASKQSASSIKSLDKKLYQLNFLGKNLKKYSSKHSKESSRSKVKSRKTSRRERKNSGKNEKPLFLFERLRKKNSIKGIKKESQYFRKGK
jgi:hypothetical protein